MGGREKEKGEECISAEERWRVKREKGEVGRRRVESDTVRGERGGEWGVECVGQR